MGLSWGGYLSVTVVILIIIIVLERFSTRGPMAVCCINMNIQRGLLMEISSLRSCFLTPLYRCSLCHDWAEVY